MSNKLYIIICFLIFSFKNIVAQNPGDTLFSSSNIHNIDIVFSQPTFWDSLMYYKMHADSFNLSTKYMMGKVVVDGFLIDSVGIKLKGNSSFGFPGAKKPITISFNEYVKGKKLEGLSSICLNNNMLDPTFMREKLMLDFMNKNGLAAPRCTYARVFYNEQYVGLYKMIEVVNKQFINTHFSDWGGNLFKGDPKGTLKWIDNNPASYYLDYELHSNNTENNWSDLVNFIDKINNTPSSNFYDTLEASLNTTQFIGQWAARNLFVDLDAYFQAPHNYYLYNNINTNKFEWCTWDVSVSFGFYPYMKEDSAARTSLFLANSILTQRMLSNNTYKTAYLNTVCNYLDFFNPTILSPIIDSIANIIYPSIAFEPDSNQMFPNEMFYTTIEDMTIPTPMGDIPALKKFINNRRNYVLAELNSIGWSCPVVSIANSVEEKKSIFPNPFTSQLIISNANLKGSQILMKIYNSFGQKVDEYRSKTNSQENQSITLNLEHLSEGIYLLHIVKDDYSKIFKIIKIN